MGASLPAAQAQVPRLTAAVCLPPWLSGSLHQLFPQEASWPCVNQSEGVSGCGDPRLTLDMWSHSETSEKDKPSFPSCGDPGGSGPESAMEGLALPPEEVTFSSFFLLLSSANLEDGI